MVSLNNENTTYPPLNLQAIIKGVLVALVITVLGSAVLGIVYHVTGITEKTLPQASTILYYVSVLVGSLLSARWAGHKGLLHGIGFAVLFVFFGWLIANYLLHTPNVSGALWQKTLFSCLIGAFGGILGVGVAR